MEMLVAFTGDEYQE